MDDKSISRILINFFGFMLIAYGLMGLLFIIAYVILILNGIPDWFTTASAGAFTTNLILVPVNLIAGIFILNKSEKFTKILLKNNQ